MMFPCPGFPLSFLPFAADEEEGVDAGARSFGGNSSSSENDSHAGSSLVTTMVLVRTEKGFFEKAGEMRNLNSLLHLSSSSFSLSSAFLADDHLLPRPPAVLETLLLSAERGHPLILIHAIPLESVLCPPPCFRLLNQSERQILSNA